jgi:hypothetical protein
MGDVVANVTFTHGGVQVRRGDVVDSTHELNVLYPARFTATVHFGTPVAGGTLGTVVASIPLTDANGTTVYVAGYGTITP